MEDVVECDANYECLTPVSFLDRAGRVDHHGDHSCMVYGDVSFTWKATRQRCIKLSSALSSLGIRYGDLVATVANNTPQLYELHFGVPMAKGVLSPLNPRLDATTLSFILEQLDPKFIFLDHHYIELILKALKLLGNKMIKIPLLVLITSDNNLEQEAITIPMSPYDTEEPPPIRSLNYNDLLDLGRIDFEPLWRPKHECDPILVNYTSGSTGTPKGVVYSHRSAYLNTIGEICRSNLRDRIAFLWTADMFRANGWGFIWAMAALGGTNVCLKHITGDAIIDSISIHGITHLSGHPTILLTILEDHEKKKNKSLPHKVYAHVAGILPSYDTMVKIQDMGFEVVHRYGMTEILGPPMIKLWKDDITSSRNSSKDISRNFIMDLPMNQSIMDNIMEEFDVKDPKTMESVPFDGKTIGEIMFKGNTVMKGYFKAPMETKKVFNGGWFRTGDMAVKHFDGSIQLKDRIEDLIVVSTKGGDHDECMMSTLEIEAVLLGHPKVLQAAVVGMPNSDGSKLNCEAPCAFVKLKIGVEAMEEEIIKFCSGRLPSQMIPQLVIFSDLAVSSTGKVQKFILREVAKVVIGSRHRSQYMIHT